MILDIKVGEGSQIKSIKHAKIFAELALNISKHFKLPTKIIISKMFEPLGSNIGNALELREALDILNNIPSNKENLKKLSLEICSRILLETRIYKNKKEALKAINQTIENKNAFNKFKEMVYTLGGEHDFFEKITIISQNAPIIRPFLSNKTGTLSKIETEALGWLARDLEDLAVKNDPEIKNDVKNSLGFSNIVELKKEVKKGEVLCYIHAFDEKSFNYASLKLLNIFKVTSLNKKIKNKLFIWFN